MVAGDGLSYCSHNDTLGSLTGSNNSWIHQGLTPYLIVIRMELPP